MLSWILVSWRKGLLAGWCDSAPTEEIFLCRSELKCTPHKKNLAHHHLFVFFLRCKTWRRARRARRLVIISLFFFSGVADDGELGGSLSFLLIFFLKCRRWRGAKRSWLVVISWVFSQVQQTQRSLTTCCCLLIFFLKCKRQARLWVPRHLLLFFSVVVHKGTTCDAQDLM